MSLLNFFEPRPKKARTDEKSEHHPLKDDPKKRDGPECIVSWNVNGLITRMKCGDWEAFGEWITKEEATRGISIDVIGIQEVKLTADGPTKAVKGDGQARVQTRPRPEGKTYRDELDIYNKGLRQRPFNSYKPYLTLADWRYSGVLVLVKEDIRVQSVFYSLHNDPKVHHPDGRILRIIFQNQLHLMITYSPNHGWEPKTWERRSQWDDSIATFLAHNKGCNGSGQALIASPYNPSDDTSDNTSDNPSDNTSDQTTTSAPSTKKRPARALDDVSLSGAGDHTPRSDLPNVSGTPGRFVWMGDLNVAPEPWDTTHDSWFQSQRHDTVGSKYDLSHPDQVGQPGVARAERQGFRRYLRLGNLEDLFRKQHPDGPPRSGEGELDVDAAHWTWRGTPGIERPEIGKYFAKAMRIDHCLVSPSVRGKVVIVGSGRFRERFFGSDHSPLMLIMDEL